MDLSLINCEIEVDLSYSKECIISEISITHADAENSNVNLSVQTREQYKQREQHLKQIMLNCMFQLPFFLLMIISNF